MLGLGKAAKNYIERYVKQQIGLNPDAREIKKLKNEVRSLRSSLARTSKIVDSWRDFACCKCNPKVEGENG